MVKVIGELRFPPDSIPVKVGDVLNYRYTDGMYAKCYNDKKEVVYITAYTKVKHAF